MATFNLRRFSRPETLRSVALEHLLEFLRPHREFLARRGFEVPARADPESFDYDGLVEVLMEPDFDTPQEMAEGLYIVDEMATPESMNDLVREAEEAGLAITESSHVQEGRRQRHRGQVAGTARLRAGRRGALRR